MSAPYEPLRNVPLPQTHRSLDVLLFLCQGEFILDLESSLSFLIFSQLRHITL